MIASVSGTVAAVAPDSAVVEVGGIGLRLMCTPSTLADLRVGSHAALATTLVVREDSLTVYGFAGEDERPVFELLQTASGIGPRLALAALAVLSADELRAAVATEDVDALCRIPGVGPKGARKIDPDSYRKPGFMLGKVLGDHLQAARRHLQAHWKNLTEEGQPPVRAAVVQEMREAVGIIVDKHEGYLARRLDLELPGDRAIEGVQWKALLNSLVTHRL